MRRTGVIVVAALLLCSVALAQSPGWIAMGAAAGVSGLIGSTAMPLGPVPLRESPPKGLLALPGKKLGELSRDSSYRIGDAKIFPHIFSTQTWIMLTRPGSDEPLGWSYLGKDPSWLKNFALRR